MSEYDLDNEEVLDTEDEASEPSKDSRQFVRDLEKQAKAGKAAAREANEAKAEANAAKRELALMKAGINLDSPTGKLFVKAYDGEISVEAIKAAAGEYGLIPTSQTAEIQNDMAALDRVSQASSGSSATVPPSVLDEIRNAASPDEVLKLLVANNVNVSRDQPGGWVSLV
jgi:rRNA maturation endonuclease Nob1